MREKLKVLSNLSGPIRKKKFLRQYPGLKPILMYALDPFKMYYMKPQKQLDGPQDQYLDEKSYQLLDNLISRKYTGDSAKYMVSEHLKLLTKNDAELFNIILSKKPRIGIAATGINTVWSGLIPTHDVMLAKKVEYPRVTYPCWGGFKVDGVRCIWRDQNFFTRNGKTLVGLDHLAIDLIRQRIDHLDAEVTVPNMNFDTGSGLIRAGDPTPSALLHMIDLPAHPSKVRRARLEAMQQYKSDVCKFIPHKVLRNREELNEFYQLARDRNFEGIIISPMVYEYVGKRTYNWMKVKPLESRDLVITGVYEGKGKYEGMLGGITIDFNGVSVDCGGGFTDIERVAIWANPDKWIGQLAEIECMEVTPYGSLRHPIFKRFRWDKDEIN